MQTFMPYPSFFESLNCLDRQRLGKQRVEAKQIIDILLGRSKKNGWINHPVVKMWRGYENALIVYYNMSLTLWKARGYQNIKLQYILGTGPVIMPLWFGDSKFHRAHQSNLTRKKPEHYRQFFPTVPNDLPYIWPVGLPSERDFSNLIVE